MGTVVGIAGMTHLGINTAVAMAARGFPVLGYDGDGALVGRLRARQMPVVEPQLDELLAANAERIDFTAEADELRRCDIVYIAADVPTNDRGESDLVPITALIDRVSQALRQDALLVILCQVPPGFTRGIDTVPAERLFYQVETLIFGRAVERALHPERFIVGCAEPTRSLPPQYRALLEAFGCPVLAMRYESAELAKISINFFLVSSVTTANVLAELSESIGADWTEIIPALRLDKRIGPHSYLNPGLGISGGNLERDLRTVLRIAEGTPVDVAVVKAWIANSQYRKEWCWRVLRDRVLAKRASARIAVLGLAYKENTHSTKNSPALALLSHLEGSDVRVHDPVVPASVVPFATGCPDPISCATGADALVLATPWPEYRGIALEDLARVMAGRIIIDPYRLVDGRKASAAGFEYHALGAPALASRTD
ncbi:MAG: nucleotide sugar dehydrogenase [Stellaceae bacterium]